MTVRFLKEIGYTIFLSTHPEPIERIEETEKKTGFLRI
jgi:predicted Zn-dependent protease